MVHWESIGLTPAPFSAFIASINREPVIVAVD